MESRTEHFRGRLSSPTSAAALLLFLFHGCGMAGDGEDGRDGPHITWSDPVDGQLVQEEDDLDGGTDGIQIDVLCLVDGFGAAEQVTLTVTSLADGTETDHVTFTDAGGSIVFSNVTLIPGTALYPSLYELSATSRQGAVSATPIRIEVVAATPMDATVENWELFCTPCEQASDCDDGLTCSGRETCVYSQINGGRCCFTVSLECDEGDEVCWEGGCFEELGGCVMTPMDADEDGHGPLVCGGLDCDDETYSVHPGAREKCDALDNDCDGAVDEDSRTPAGDPVMVSTPDSEPGSPSLAPGDTHWGVAWISDTGASRTVEVGSIEPGTSGPVVRAQSVAFPEGEPLEVVAVTRDGGWLVFGIESHHDGWSTLFAIEAGMGSAPVFHEVLGMDGSMHDLDVAVTEAGEIGVFFRSDKDGDWELYMIPMTWPTALPLYGEVVQRITWSLGFSGMPSAAGRASGWAVAWEDSRSGNSEIYLGLVDHEGGIETPHRRITEAPGDSLAVSLARSPETSRLALAWMDSREGGFDTLVTCLDEDGANACTEMTLEDGAGIGWYPHLVYDGWGSQFAMAFAGRQDDLFAMHLTAIATDAPSAAGIESGIPFGDEALGILDPVIADAGAHRGVLWISSETAGTNRLLFQQLDCID